jgi:hypothetical protein
MEVQQGTRQERVAVISENVVPEKLEQHLFNRAPTRLTIVYLPSRHYRRNSRNRRK